MAVKKVLVGLAMTAAVAGCMSIPREMTVAEYCADERRANQNVCRLKVEIDGTETKLADTNLRLSEARSLAGDALRTAEGAQLSADRAQATADEALSRANSALLKPSDLECTTRVIQQTDVGTCEPGYTLMSCTQTRYTTRAGGLSFIREIDDEQCRFNARVLEMHVRCCRGSETPSSTTVVPVPQNSTRPSPLVGP